MQTVRHAYSNPVKLQTPTLNISCKKNSLNLAHNPKIKCIPYDQQLRNEPSRQSHQGGRSVCGSFSCLLSLLCLNDFMAQFGGLKRQFHGK